MNLFIYAYHFDNRIIYIGCTKDVFGRFSAHYSDTRPISIFLNKLRELNQYPTVSILGYFDKKIAYAKEAEFIKTYSLKYDLLNYQFNLGKNRPVVLISNGVGWPLSEEEIENYDWGKIKIPPPRKPRRKPLPRTMGKEVRKMITEYLTRYGTQADKPVLDNATTIS